jgi:hypothetical protein
MKRFLMVAGILCVAFFLVSCGGDDPSSVAKKFYEAVEKGDTNAVERYSNAETAAMIAALGEKASETAGSRGKITDASEKSNDGEKAVVVLTFADGDTEELDLVKVDGKWKVSMGK